MSSLLWTNAEMKEKGNPIHFFKDSAKISLGVGGGEAVICNFCFDSQRQKRLMSCTDFYM